MFQIQLIYNNEPMNKISKNVDNVINTLEGSLRDESSIVDPVIMIESENPITANYAFIPAFNRYYFIRNIEVVRTNLWRLTMHTDVLRTFSEGILGSPCIVAKSSNRFNMYLNDSNYKCFQNDYVSVQRFPSGFDYGDRCYVITIFGDKTLTPEPEPET